MQQDDIRYADICQTGTTIQKSGKETILHPCQQKANRGVIKDLEYHINDDMLGELSNLYPEFANTGLPQSKVIDRDVKSTRLTDENGKLYEDIVQSYIGNHLDSARVADRYLYDAYTYDSDLERTNLRTLPRPAQQSSAVTDNHRRGNKFGLKHIASLNKKL